MCEELEPIAYHYGLTPAEFYNSVPARFFRFIEARKKIEHENYIIENIRFGKLCSVVVNMFSKTITRPSDFFDVKYRYKEKKQANVEEIAIRLMGYCARLGGNVEL